MRKTPGGNGTRSPPRREFRRLQKQPTIVPDDLETHANILFNIAVAVSVNPNDHRKCIHRIDALPVSSKDETPAEWSVRRIGPGRDDTDTDTIHNVRRNPEGVITVEPPVDLEQNIVNEVMKKALSDTSAWRYDKQLDASRCVCIRTNGVAPDDQAATTASLLHK